jgi:hypothetical protein
MFCRVNRPAHSGFHNTQQPGWMQTHSILSQYIHIIKIRYGDFFWSWILVPSPLILLHSNKRHGTTEWKQEFKQKFKANSLFKQEFVTNYKDQTLTSNTPMNMKIVGFKPFSNERKNAFHILPFCSLVMVYTEKGRNARFFWIANVPKCESHSTTNQPHWFKKVLIRRCAAMFCIKTFPGKYT